MVRQTAVAPAGGPHDRGLLSPTSGPGDRGQRAGGGSEHVPEVGAALRSYLDSRGRRARLLYGGSAGAGPAAAVQPVRWTLPRPTRPPNQRPVLRNPRGGRCVRSSQQTGANPLTYVFDDPAQFKRDASDGFALAYPRYVARVPGASGFVRATPPPAGKVSLVVGGGSGHYPSYAGLVGSGLADGCVLGELRFALGDAGRAGCPVDRNGHGVVLPLETYAGDRLNFGVAQERLRRDGIDFRIVYVTDDIASAPPEERDRRRGIAGTFFVYKVGGAAAERGGSLDEVETLMQSANAATFSFGVAFGGCTLPGERQPLFSVDAGRMELGLGIHGEPGIRSVQWLPATELARIFVDAILAERPPGCGTRAGVVVDGLGATEYGSCLCSTGASTGCWPRKASNPCCRRWAARRQPRDGGLLGVADVAR